MKTIYLDSEFRCHVSADETMQAVETTAFDGKCDTYIEGYRLIPDGCSWTNSDGTVLRGLMVFPCRPLSQLDAAQQEYEQALIADMQNALNTLGVTVDG